MIVNEVHIRGRHWTCSEPDVSGVYCLAGKTDGEVPPWCQPYVERWGPAIRHPSQPDGLGWAEVRPIDGDDRRTHIIYTGMFVWHLPIYDLVPYPAGVHELWHCRDGRQMLVSRMATSHVENCMAFMERKVIAASSDPNLSPTRARYLAHRHGLWVRRFDDELRLRATGQSPAPPLSTRTG